MTTKAARGRIGYWAGMAAALVLGAGASGAESLGLHPDLTAVSKYMAHGWNIGGDHPAWEPSLTVDALCPGLQMKAWYNLPVDNGRQEFFEQDYLLMYNRTICPDSPWAANLHVYGDYWTYPNTKAQGEVDEASGEATEDTKGFKYHAGITLPKLLPIGPAALVPSYNYYYWTPQNHGAFLDGSVHEFFLAYGLPMASVLPVESKQALNLGGSVNYHTGAMGVESGWSHSTAHLSTTFEVATLKITPSVNYQWSFEKSVDSENEFWATLSVARDF